MPFDRIHRIPPLALALATLPAFAGDGMVNGADLGLMLVAWGTEDPVVDLSEDGQVDGADLGLLLAFWGGCP